MDALAPKGVRCMDAESTASSFTLNPFSEKMDFASHQRWLTLKLNPFSEKMDFASHQRWLTLKLNPFSKKCIQVLRDPSLKSREFCNTQVGTPIGNEDEFLKVPGSRNRALGKFIGRAVFKLPGIYHYPFDLHRHWCAFG